MGTATGLGVCECGCGKKTRIAVYDRPECGWISGHPKRFIHGHNGAKTDEIKAMDFWGKFRFVQGILPSFCWQWTGAVNKGGYGVNYLFTDNVCAHRIAFTETGGEIPEGLELDHLCRNRRCINPHHLEPVTRTVNSRRGSKTKLTEEQALEIRLSRLPERKLAPLYGVSRGAVSGIKRGATWKGVGQ